MQPTPIFLPGESHGQRSLVGYSPWGHRESDTTERAHPWQVEINWRKLPGGRKQNLGRVVAESYFMLPCLRAESMKQVC